VGRSLALIAPVAPLLIAVLRLTMPYNTLDSSRTMLAKVAAHPGREQLLLVLGTFGLTLCIPAYLAIARLTQRERPRLTTAALTLAVLGYVGGALALLTDQLLLSIAHVGLSAAPGLRLYDDVAGGFTASFGTWAFVFGHVVGTILLGVALVRSRAIPRWAGWAVLLSQPIHFVSAVVITSHPLDFAGWMLLAVGFLVAARQIRRAGVAAPTAS
jgi:hypothetical protein